MARCGCASGSCSCLITGGTGITVTGVGSQDNPYVVNGAFFATSDSPTVSLTLTGTGTTLDPYRIVANAHLTMDQLVDVSAPSPTAGYVMTYVTSPSASWIAAVPQSGIPGAVLHDSTMVGDGTPSSALGVKLDPTGGIINGVSGLKSATGYTVCTSTTRPPSPFDYQYIFETDTQAFGYWMPSPGRWRMFDTKMQPYLAKVRSGWAGTTVGTGGYERGWYMRQGALIEVDFTIYLGGPGSNMGYGPLTVDIPFKAVGGAEGVNNHTHGGSGFCQGSGFGQWVMTPAIWPGDTKAHFWAPVNFDSSYQDYLRSTDASNAPGTGVPNRAGSYPLTDGSFLEGHLTYFAT